MMKFLMALQFLTIIPSGKSAVLNDDDIAKSASFFVLAGLVQGLFLAAVSYAAGKVFPADLVIGIILIIAGVVLLKRF